VGAFSSEHLQGMAAAGSSRFSETTAASPRRDSTSVEVVLRNWAMRPPASNDALLRSSFMRVLQESADAPPEAKLIMYDACDEHEVKASLGDAFRKRLDARRGTKPGKSMDQRDVCTPFDESKFHFGKIRNDKERLLKLKLSSGRYDVLTNKFPLFPKHMLLVANALAPQQMTATHLVAITEVLQASSFCAYFNSWCASASVNHFHCHLIDEFPPVTNLPLVPGPVVAGTRCLQPQGFPGFCFVFEYAKMAYVDHIIRAMQEDNQPHNLLFTPRHVYVWPKPLVRPARSFDLYPETVGGPELLGSFTVYTPEHYAALAAESADELVRINTSPLPSRLFAMAMPASSVPVDVTALDDAAVLEKSTTDRAVSRRPIGASHTVDQLPTFSLHSQSWPQDRPIARALANNIGLC